MSWKAFLEGIHYEYIAYMYGQETFEPTFHFSRSVRDYVGDILPLDLRRYVFIFHQDATFRVCDLSSRPHGCDGGFDFDAISSSCDITNEVTLFVCYQESAFFCVLYHDLDGRFLKINTQGLSLKQYIALC